MRAVVLNSFGPPPEFGVRDVSPPQMRPGCVRIRVHAVGFGFPDALMLAGKYQAKSEPPFTPGNEIAGIVTEVAADVVSVRPGTRVLAMASIGGLADECIVAASALVALPASMSMAVAAGFLVNYGTTYHALVQRANLKPSETLLVLGAAGGAGLTAIEIGKALGARVLAAASTDEKLEIAKRHGADGGFNYTRDSIKTKVKELTGDNGIDVAYDPVGADYAEQVVRSMAWNGRYLVIGFAGGNIPAIPLNLPLLKGCSLVGVFWGAHVRREPQVHATNLAALFGLFESGKLRPSVTELDGLERLPEALDLINGRRSTGKVVIRVTSENA
ncbi:MAG: NADPH:quinone oxidoreductase family protein [Steroidobacteraceae bacterium]|nr:NADPH:quinone oxidoreductase family protein [Steroidobacteraceae bacterium]